MNWKSLISIFLISALGGAATYWMVESWNLAPRTREGTNDGAGLPASHSVAQSQSPRAKKTLPEESIPKLEPPREAERSPAQVEERIAGWNVEKGPINGVLKRLSGMDYRPDDGATDPWDVSQSFLDEYGDLWRIDRATLNLQNLQPGEAAVDVKKVIYEQTIDGVLVENARLAFFFLEDGTLYEVQSNLAEQNQIPANVQPEINSLQAAEIASAAIAANYAAAGAVIPASLQAPSLAAKAQFRLFLSATGVVTKRYRFVYIVSPAGNMVPGEYEMAVDTVTRSVVTDRIVSRN